MCVRVCSRVSPCVRVCPHVSACVRECPRVYACVRVCACACMRVFGCVHVVRVYPRVFACVRVCPHVSACVRVRPRVSVCDHMCPRVSPCARRHNVKRMVLAALGGDLYINLLRFALIKMCKPYWMIVFSLSISRRTSTVHPGPIGQLVKIWTRG